MMTELYTERLLLRPFTADDATTVQALCNNENIAKTTLYIPFPYTLEHATTWIAATIQQFQTERAYTFAITKGDAVIGAMTLSHNKAFRQGELAYWIGEPYWNKGYGTEAARTVVAFGFEQKKLHKICARFFASNPASGKIMEKIGMQQEGILRDHVYKNGRYENLVCYSMLAHETHE